MKNTIAFALSCAIGLILIFSATENIRKIRAKNYYNLGYNQGLHDVKKILDKQVASPRTTVTKIYWDDTLVYWIHKK